MKGLFIFLLFFCRVCIAANTDDDNGGDIKISPKCAAVLLAAAGAAGVTVSTFTPAALCGAGFCSTGIASGSFASWWQSTLPIVAKGSVFSYLQSVAMGGTASTTALNAAALGVGVGVIAFCTYVDEADPNSAAGRSFDATYYAVTTVIETAEQANAKCAASETCSAGMEMMTSAANVIFRTVSDVKKEVEEQCNASPACVSAKDDTKSLISSVANTASAFWSDVKDGASLVAARYEALLEEGKARKHD
jgi:hypothetical protein